MDLNSRKSIAFHDTLLPFAIRFVSVNTRFSRMLVVYLLHGTWRALAVGNKSVLSLSLDHHKRNHLLSIFNVVSVTL